MKRVYDFDKLDNISEALGMDLYYDRLNGSYKDRLSSNDPIEMDSYFEWEIIKMLDALSDETVKDFLCTIKYNIIRGRVVEYFNKNTVKSSELLQDDFQIDDDVVIFSTSNKQEAEKEFLKYHCDANMVATQTDYQVNIEYYELEEVEVDENNDIVNFIDSTIATFILSEYSCNPLHKSVGIS